MDMDTVKVLTCIFVTMPCGRILSTVCLTLITSRNVKYREYTELTVPQYATRHNASLVLKYSVPRLRTIFSVTDGVASGRPYHNPDCPD